METSDNLRFTKLVLNNGLAIPALGFGTLIPDPTDTKNAVIAALEVGFRQFDCAERYRNEAAVGEAFQQMFQAGKVRREEVFIGTKLWNNNHRPERVRPASKRASGDSSSNMPTFMPFILRSPSNPETSRTQGIAAMAVSRKASSHVRPI